MQDIEWIEWAGGEMPVPFGTKVEVRHRDGDIFTDEAGSGFAEDWTIEADELNDGDIVAYRVLA